jgi:hypothetical protein
VTDRRRLHEWRVAGICDRVLSLVVDEREEVDRLVLSPASRDCSTVRAKGDGGKMGPKPANRGC